MSVVVADPLVLSEGAGFTPDHPIIGWRNIITPSNVFGTQFAADGYPVSNLANPATFLKWKSLNNVDQSILVALGGETIDYIAIARHNLSTIGATVYITDGVSIFAGPVILPNDGPAIFRFNPVTVASIQLYMTGASAPPEIGVMYVGKLLVLERRIYVGHVPMPHGRTWKATNGQSESGQFLGRIVLQEFVKSKIPLSLLSPDWFRAYLDPFLEVAQEIPFFFAWRPQTYPYEVGYGWLTGEPAPTPTAPSNLISLNLDVSGIR